MSYRYRYAYLLRRSAVFALALLLMGLGLGSRSAAAETHPRLVKKGKYKVKVDSAPPGATIYLDSKEYPPVGVTPWTNTKIADGTYILIVELEGYKSPPPRTIKIVKSSKLQEIFVPLEKIDPTRIDIQASADKNVIGAQVVLDGQEQGQAPIVLATKKSGRHLVELRKDGFEQLSTWVEGKDGETITFTPVLKPIVKARMGTLLVDADVFDAEVRMDGNRVAGTTPVVIDAVEGLHVIEVRKDPAIPWKQTVQAVAGQQVKVRAELRSTLGGQGGSIRVLSNVAGAEVFLDGTPMGKVPVDIKDVKSGEHVLEVKAAGHQDREERVTVNAGQSFVLKLDLNVDATRGDGGVLKVVSLVPDADVFIDGASIGKAPQEKQVARGEHFVVVKLAGYKTFEQKIRVESGQTLTVSAELKAVARLRVISEPAGAEVVVNGLPQGVTPLDLNEIEVGTTIVRVIKAGFQTWDQTIELVGGKSELISANLQVEGPSEIDLVNEQRGLSSFGARTLPRGRSTIDFGAGYPYFLDARVNVGAGRLAGFGFDAGVGARSMASRSEIGFGLRFMLADRDPFSLGMFGELWWGSKLLDDSKRNGATFNLGAIASLTAFTRVTVSGRVYMNLWSDRHCPELVDGEFDGTPIETCQDYRDGTLSQEERTRVEKLTGQTGDAFYERETGARLNVAIATEIAVKQRWNLWFLLEGAPFQDERALFTQPFSGAMFTTDYITYGRAGLSYKF